MNTELERLVNPLIEGNQCYNCGTPFSIEPTESDHDLAATSTRRTETSDIVIRLLKQIVGNIGSRGHHRIFDTILVKPTYFVFGQPIWGSPTSYNKERNEATLVMAARSTASDISDDQMDAILQFIDEETKMSVSELANQTEYSARQVQRILEALMERGRITSTPGWEYRQSRRSEA